MRERERCMYVSMWVILDRCPNQGLSSVSQRQIVWEVSLSRLHIGLS